MKNERPSNHSLTDVKRDTAKAIFDDLEEILIPQIIETNSWKRTKKKWIGDKK